MISKMLKKVISISVSILLLCVYVPEIAFADEAEPDTVRIYLSISDDSEFVTGRDSSGRVMARVPIDVPYVDLADYGLENYYRYEAKPFEEGGQYVFPYVLVEKPTLLMCFIKALSQYYLGREMTRADVGTKAMEVSGGATSLYFLHYFGHYYNFMYFVNHAYPLMAKGWGSTADYILLKDEDEIDIGMFSDTRFNQYGGFAYFDQGNVSLTAGESLDLTLYLTKSKESGGSDYNGPMYKEPIRISSDYGKNWKTNQYVTDKQGEFTASFDEAGVYYISGGPKFKNQPYQQLQCIAPPICVVEVKPAPVAECLYEINGASVDVTWKASPGAEGYEIRYIDNDGNEKTVRQEGTEITLDDADTDEVSVTVTPYVTDRYVAMEEEYKTLKGKPVKAALDFFTRYIDEVSTYPDYSLYREAEQAEIHDIVDGAIEDIRACSLEEDAAEVVRAAKEKIDALKTKAQYEEEEQGGDADGQGGDSSSDGGSDGKQDSDKPSDGKEEDSLVPSDGDPGGSSDGSEVTPQDGEGSDRDTPESGDGSGSKDEPSDDAHNGSGKQSGDNDNEKQNENAGDSSSGDEQTGDKAEPPGGNGSDETGPASPLSPSAESGRKPDVRSVKSITIDSKKVTKKTVAKAIKAAGGSYRYVTKITLGKKVKKISKGAFSKCKKVKTLVVKTKKLKKKSVKGALRKSKIRTVSVRVGSRKSNRKFVRKYRKFFIKKVCGRKVRIK